jgi:hypothetical protein
MSDSKKKTPESKAEFKYYTHLRITHPSWPDTIEEDSALLESIVEAVANAVQKLAISNSGIELDIITGWQQQDYNSIPLANGKK